MSIIYDVLNAVLKYTSFRILNIKTRNNWLQVTSYHTGQGPHNPCSAIFIISI